MSDTPYEPFDELPSVDPADYEYATPAQAVATATAAPVSVTAAPAVKTSQRQHRTAPSAAPSPVFTGLPAFMNFKASDYPTVGFGSGVHKLADSAVAPLVAAARGYNEVTASNCTTVAAEIGLKFSSAQGKRFRRAAESADSDALIMPWYKAALLRTSLSNGTEPIPSTFQFRPKTPEIPAGKKKPSKYEFVSQQGTPIDVHPAVPASWWDGPDVAPTVLLAEGMLKGDSGLTGLLLDCGITREQLLWNGTDSRNPREVLSALMEAIPVDKRIFIMNIGGVGNWHHNGEWNTMDLKGRSVWVAFDADVIVNRQVYKQAQDMFKFLEQNKGAIPYLLSPTPVMGDDGLEEKIGIDDYLARVGDFATLIQALSPTLPSAPSIPEADTIGQWLVESDGMSVYEVAKRLDDNGDVNGTTKIHRVDLGGRVLTLDQYRQPHPSEMTAGVFNEAMSAHAEERTVAIEISWNDGGEPRTVVVDGPDKILGKPAREWERDGTIIPPKLLLHPSWPPKDMEWVAAIKRNRADEIIEVTQWTRMGWVPVIDDVPAYVVGESIIGPISAETNAASGVTEARLSGSSSFGVGGELPDTPFEDVAYQERLIKAIKVTVEMYLESGVWTDPSLSSSIFAAGLRPALPIPTITSAFFVGPKNGGKSFSAKIMMGFWQAQPGCWQSTLPGSPKDTAAATEIALAQTPIWVYDDLAPSNDVMQNRKEQAALGNLIRSVFNRSGKRRATQDMKSRGNNSPQALFVATAENPLSVSSERERTTTLEIRHGSLAADTKVTGRLSKMLGAENYPALVTGGLIRYLRWCGQNEGWETTLAGLNLDALALNDKVVEHLSNAPFNFKKGSVARSASLAADLILVMNKFADMCRELGFDDDFVDSFKLEEDTHAWHILTMIAKSHADHQQNSPGLSVIAAVQSLMASGRAHVTAGDDPSRPPITGESSAVLNTRLGWTPTGVDLTLKPSGVNIGHYLHNEDPEKRVLLLEKDTAFKEAQRHSPERLPHGMQPSTVWQALWDEKLAAMAFESSRSKGTRAPSPTVRLRVPGNAGVRLSGVPILLSTLLSDVSGPDEDDSED